MSLTETEYSTNWQYFLLHDLSVDVLSVFGGGWWVMRKLTLSNHSDSLPCECLSPKLNLNPKGRVYKITLLLPLHYSLSIPPTITEHLLSFYNLSRARTERGIILTWLFCFTTRERKNVLLLWLINSWTKHTLFSGFSGKWLITAEDFVPPRFDASCWIT